MSGGTKCSTRYFYVGTASIIGNILVVARFVNIHFTATIGTIHQSCKGVVLAPTVRIAFDISSYSLHIIKVFLVDNRLVGVFKDEPVIFEYIFAFLVFEMLSCFEVDRMP